MMISRFAIRGLPTIYQVLKNTNRNYMTIPSFRTISFYQMNVNPVSLSNIIGNRTLSTATEVEVDYDYVKTAIKNENVVIIDVREPEELKEHDVIPSSVHIPLGNVKNALKMSDNEFKATFNAPKPSEDKELIFYCMIGKRSAKAQRNAVELGYKNAKNYMGSWNDWVVKSKI